METHIQEWLALLLRWGHFIAGVAWIGASFYFNWLENHLDRRQPETGLAGDLWAVHGGGFYHLRKFAVAPDKLPATLHWFKWEAYATLLSGLALLAVVFYWNAQAYLMAPDQIWLSSNQGIAAGLASLLLSWLLYDGLCRSPLVHRQTLFLGLILLWFTALAWLLGFVFSGRAAYIHVGAAIGTLMVANVWRVIIPAQKELVSSVTAGRLPDPAPGKAALLRSRHNNYFTLPVLFIMISSHFPGTYGAQHGWLVLLMLSLIGVSVRHYFNQRHLPGFQAWPLYLAAVLLLALIWSGAPRRQAVAETPQASVTAATVFAIMQRRCITCHAPTPAHAAFSSPPMGVELDSMDKLRLQAERVYRASVITRTMPLGNLTGMTEEERHVIARWFENSQQIQ